MKALVTGANGFLGSHLVDRLLKEGWEVHVLIRKSSNIQWLMGKKIQYHFGGLTEDLSGLERGLVGVDVCFHVAGIIQPKKGDHYGMNSEGTANLLASALKVNPKIKRIVVISSTAARGPKLENSLATEKEECHPLTEYGKSKREAENVAIQHFEKLPITIIRPPVIYGPRDTLLYRYFWLSRRGVTLLPGWNTGLMNLVYVDDLVEGLFLVSQKPEAVGEIFYMGSAENLLVGNVAETVGRSVRKKRIHIKIPNFILYLAAWFSNLVSSFSKKHPFIKTSQLDRFSHAHWGLDISKASRILNYRPQTPLKRGAETTAAWYIDQGWFR
jgi:dihydroflavonol-4-reductase